MACEALRLYGLLYVGENASRSQVELYLKCGITLSNSCALAGVPFSIISNRKDYLEDILATTDHFGVVNVVAVDFDREVPLGIGFREAHFKLDVYSLFGAGLLGDRVGLLDLDVVILDGQELRHPRKNDLEYFNVWSQVSSENDVMRVARELEELCGGKPKDLLWAGGELIMGTKEGFAMLSKEVEKIWPIYLKNVEKVFHQGDEMITTAAILNLMKEGPAIAIQPFTQVSRWWSARTNFIQKTLGEAIKSPVLHLPGDKVFLSTWATKEFNASAF